MVWKPITLDDSVTRFSTGDTYVHVAEGPYLLQLTKVAASPEDLNYESDDVDPYFMFDLRIEDGADGHGKSLRYFGRLSNADASGSGGAWTLGRILHFLGADPKKLVNASFPTYAHLAAYAGALEKALLASGPKGKVGAEVADNQRTDRGGKVRLVSQITGFFPSSEWDLRKQSNSALPAAVSTPPNGGQSRTSAASPSLGSAPAPASTTSNGSAEKEPEDAGDLEALVNSMFPTA
jgi:hypothetical protein